jgi:hypothetical protein
LRKLVDLEIEILCWRKLTIAKLCNWRCAESVVRKGTSRTIKGAAYRKYWKFEKMLIKLW